jgi:acyl carrier protein
MSTPPNDIPALKNRLKHMIIEVCDIQDLSPDEIDDDARLIRGEGRLDLGSLDAIEISAAIDKEYGVRIEDLSAAKAAFRSVSSLAAHIAREKGWSTAST